VYIDKDGHIYLNENRTSLEQIVADLSQDALNKSEGTVYVKADKDVHYGCVIQTVDKLKVAGGVRYVALATQKHA
jgi:biopolymer transport protein ExbD